MKQGSKLTPKGAKIVAALERFRDAIEAGAPIEQRYTVRRVKLDLTPRPFGPDEVKGIQLGTLFNPSSRFRNVHDWHFEESQDIRNR